MQTDAIDPTPLLAQVRETFLDFDAISAQIRAVEPAAELAANATQDDFFATMSAPLAERVRRYAEATAQDPLVLLRYTAGTDNMPRAMLDSGRKLPAQQGIVQFSSTTTVADADTITVDTEMLTATRQSYLDSGSTDSPRPGTPTKPRPGQTTDGPAPTNPEM